MGNIHKLLLTWQCWKPIWRKREKWNGWFLPLAIISSICIFIGIPYSAINQLMNERDTSFFDLTTPLDTSIPFVAWMIIPYSFLYIFYPAGSFLAPRTDRGGREVIALLQCLLLASWATFMIFIIFPTEITLRQQIPLDIRMGEGVWGWVYGSSLHRVDYPWNAWPSLHIIHSVLIGLTIEYWWKQRGHQVEPIQQDSPSGLSEKAVFIRITLLRFMWVLLALSTLFTKQHYIFDFITGLAVGLLAWNYLLKPSLHWAATIEASEYTAKWDDN